MSDLILVNEKGSIVAGKHKGLNKAAFTIHSSLHQARPDVIAVAHSHTVYGKTWSTFGKLLDPLTQDSCIFYDDHALFSEYNGVVDDSSEGERIGKALGDRKALILQNHGLLTVGHSIEECVFWFVTMERTCQSQLIADSSAHDAIKIEHEVALKTRDYEVGFPLAGYFSFQPLWQDIVSQQSDFIDLADVEGKLVL